MDTGTHIVMGIALGGLAIAIDPSVPNNSVTANAIMAGAIIGSQAPDLDTVLKLRNNAKYIRNHRGLTHSIPAVILWPILIVAGIYLFAPEAELIHVWFWTFLSVILHVFVDIFNAYGTQALRPFTKKWIALGVIKTFDPFIFFSHVVALILWAYGSDAAVTFLSLYSIIFIYYILRFYAKRRVIKAIQAEISDVQEINISPTYRFYEWHVAITTEDHFYVARARKDELIILDLFKKVPIPSDPVMEAAKKDDNLAAFLSFSPVYRWQKDQYDDYYEVRFTDLRYRNKGHHYPFVAIVKLDRNLNIISSYTGWVPSEEKLMKKLN